MLTFSTFDTFFLTRIKRIGQIRADLEFHIRFHPPDQLDPRSKKTANIYNVNRT